MKNKPCIFLTNGEQYVGLREVEDGAEICLVNSALEALDYRSFIFWIDSKRIIRNAEKRLDTKLYVKKISIVIR